MLNISMQDAKDNLSELINLVEQGEDVFIIGNNKAKIKLVSFTEKPKARVFGQHRNRVIMSEDFNDSLSDDFWLGNASAHENIT